MCIELSPHNSMPPAKLKHHHGRFSIDSMNCQSSCKVIWLAIRASARNRVCTVHFAHAVQFKQFLSLSRSLALSLSALRRELHFPSISLPFYLCSCGSTSTDTPYIYIYIYSLAEICSENMKLCTNVSSFFLDKRKIELRICIKLYSARKNVCKHGISIVYSEINICVCMCWKHSGEKKRDDIYK